ncbi:MAG: hypothetical protein GXO58_10685 [Thermodesulfobacteria bacterium]|nr:hypothetical protein [Thermodesulfobacteriota bacterium]
MNIVEKQEKLAAITKEYIDAIEDAISTLEKEIKEAMDVEKSGNPEWEKSIEGYIDELHSIIFSLPEPRHGHKDLHKKIAELRKRIKDIYADFKAMIKKG